MKKLLLFCFISSITLGFVSCGSDDDEIFISTDAQAKEMIKGQWTVTSMKMESNYPDFDKGMNQSYTQVLQENVHTMLFLDDYVVSTTTSKKNTNTTVTENDKYHFLNNILYVEDSQLKIALKHDYKISEKTLMLSGHFTRDVLIEVLKAEEALLGEDYTEIIKAIPSNFSGKLNYTLKR